MKNIHLVFFSEIEKQVYHKTDLQTSCQVFSQRILISSASVRHVHTHLSHGCGDTTALHLTGWCWSIWHVYQLRGIFFVLYFGFACITETQWGSGESTKWSISVGSQFLQSACYPNMFGQDAEPRPQCLRMCDRQKCQGWLDGLRDEVQRWFNEQHQVNYLQMRGRSGAPGIHRKVERWTPRSTSSTHSLCYSHTTPNTLRATTTGPGNLHTQTDEEMKTRKLQGKHRRRLEPGCTDVSCTTIQRWEALSHRLE